MNFKVLLKNVYNVFFPGKYDKYFTDAPTYLRGTGYFLFLSRKNNTCFLILLFLFTRNLHCISDRKYDM